MRLTYYVEPGMTTTFNHVPVKSYSKTNFATKQLSAFLDIAVSGQSERTQIDFKTLLLLRKVAY